MRFEDLGFREVPDLGSIKLCPVHPSWGWDRGIYLPYSTIVNPSFFAVNQVRFFSGLLDFKTASTLAVKLFDRLTFQFRVPKNLTQKNGILKNPRMAICWGVLPPNDHQIATRTKPRILSKGSDALILLYSGFWRGIPDYLPGLYCWSWWAFMSFLDDHFLY